MICARNASLTFQVCCFISKPEHLKVWLKNLRQISQFFTPVKIMEGWSELRFQAQRRSQSVIYFSRGAAAQTWKFNTFPRPKFQKGKGENEPQFLGDKDGTKSKFWEDTGALRVCFKFQMHLFLSELDHFEFNFGPDFVLFGPT